MRDTSHDFRVQARAGLGNDRFFRENKRNYQERSHLLGKKERTHRTRCILNQECAGAYEREPGCTGPL